MTTQKLIALIAVPTFDAALLCGTAYLVFWCETNPWWWWFLLAVVRMAGVDRERGEA